MVTAVFVGLLYKQRVEFHVNSVQLPKYNYKVMDFLKDKSK